MELAPTVEMPTSNSVEDLTNALHIANQRITQQFTELQRVNEEWEKMTLFSAQKSIEANHLHDLLSFASAGHRILRTGTSWTVIFNN